MAADKTGLEQFAGTWKEIGSHNVYEFLETVGLSESENCAIKRPSVIGKKEEPKSKLKFVLEGSNSEKREAQAQAFTIFKQTSRPRWRRIQRGNLTTPVKVKTGLGSGSVVYTLEDNKLTSTLNLAKVNGKSPVLKDGEVFTSKMTLKGNGKLECRLTCNGRSLLKIFAPEEAKDSV